MDWTIAAPFFQVGTENTWIDDFVKDSKHRFLKVGRLIPSGRNWHQRIGRGSPIADWQSYWSQASDAVNQSKGGVVTLFPQLPAIIGLRQNLKLMRDCPVVAWCYNVGMIRQGLPRIATRLAMKHVNRIVVHSSGEIPVIADWLELPLDRFSFVPLQIGELAIEEDEEMRRPFALAMGSANRDYETLFKAVSKIGLRTIVVAAPRAIAGLSVPPNVELLHGLSLQQCRSLAQRARINIIPLHATLTASGQRTVIQAMRFARPVISTQCVGTVDYIANGKTGLLTAPGNDDELTNAIGALWDDSALRENLRAAAVEFVSKNCSDESAAIRFAQILDDVQHTSQWHVRH
jgi:hypothetical protein